MDTIYYSGNFCFFLYALSFIASTLPFTNCKCKYSKYVYSWRLEHWMKNTLHTLISFKVVEFQLWNNIAISRINAHTNTHFNFNIWEKKNVNELFTEEVTSIYCLAKVWKSISFSLIQRSLSLASVFGGRLVVLLWEPTMFCWAYKSKHPLAKPNRNTLLTPKRASNVINTISESYEHTHTHQILFHKN